MADTPHVQTRFFTKQQRYAVPDTPFSVPIEVEREQLSELINGVLQDNREEQEDDRQIQFDFLLDGEFLRTSLAKHLESKEISFESEVNIEYVERQAAPRPEQSLEHDDWVSAIQATGQHILSGSYDNTVHLWKTTGESIMTIPGHSAPVKCVSWIKHDESDPVSTFVTGSHDQSVLVWQWNRDSNEVDCRLSCCGHAASVDCVAVSPSGKQMCTGSWDRTLNLWSTETPPADSGGGDSNRPSKRKKSSTSSTQTVDPLLSLSGHREAVSAVQWIDPQTLVTSSWDHTVRLWDLEQAKQTSELPGTKAILSLSYSPLSHMLVTGSADRHVRLYDPRNSDSMVVKCSFTSHTGWVVGVHWSPNREHLFLSGSYDAVLKLWDIRSPKAPLYDMVKQDDRILAVDWSVPALMLSAGVDNKVHIYEHSQ